MLHLWHEAYGILAPRERRQAWAILALMVASSFLEVVGIVSVVPFLSVLENPGWIDSNAVLSAAYRLGGFTDAQDFMVMLGVLAFVLLVTAAGVRGLTVFCLSRYIQACRLEISCRLLEGYLHQAYGFFLGRHSGEMSNLVLSEVDMFVDSALMPMAQTISYSLVLAALVSLLIYVDPLTAISAAAVIGGAYVLIYRVIRERLTRSGQERLEANRARFEAASEGFAGIKSIKIMGLEGRTLTRFRVPSVVAARSIVLNNTLGQMPRMVIEATAFGGIIVLAMGLALRREGDSAAVLPVLGLYAFAAYRMLPAVQSIYQNLSNLRFVAPVVERLAEELAECQARPPVTGAAQMRLTRDLQLEGLGFDYGATSAQPTARGAGIAEISLTLPVGHSLGIIGTTGAGKTTLVDVMLGLLEHQTGEMRVDGTPVTASNRRAWQDRLGYVPQDIYLTASSIAENIAFGLPEAEIDRARVAEVARMARIADFIETELPEGYATQVGERGVMLSGGQRQRIGIARALYRDPDVIVFDEATSALDTETETAVMEALAALAGRKTLIIVAHRLTTIARCDQVIRLEQGRIVARLRGADLVS
ncbi:MAG: ABC transporter ATP-binding protein [Gemmobacter sp.]|uniref:ABC transporter ATP-binding protein n=1 Tax=Gemmobacter sp. TaxID=1898957 RepID=UPI001A5396F8|nr:ABC transporter ATP-binding protein [Gemmobacter sp.]MBL8563249.1 ABC transporter ATP-binding protein [Gemmobacter sp.]